MNFYEEKIKEIKDLINKGEKTKATSLLKDELNMPYIPRKYESQFLDLRDKLISPKDNSKETLMTQDEALTALYSDDEVSKVIAISNMKKMNIRSFIDQVIKWIETSSESERVLVANLYELLVEQEIDVDIKIDSIKLNPLKSEDPLKSEYIEMTLNSIEKKEIDEIIWKEHAIDQTMLYVLKSFPKKLEKDISSQILNIVAYLFGEGKLTKEEKDIALTIGHIL